MLKLQELKRSLFGPNPKEIIPFCGVATFVQTQETISVHKMALKRLPFISQLFNGSVGRNCSSCLPQGAHMPKGLETKLEFLFVVALKLSPFTKDFRGGELLWVRSVFFETLLTAELHWNVKSRVNLTVYQQAVEGHAAGHFLYLQPLQSTRHAFVFI